MPFCGSSAHRSKPCSKNCDRWDGKKQQCKTESYALRFMGSPSSGSLSTVPNWPMMFYGTTEQVDDRRADLMDETAGGHLTVDVDSRGRATRVYGIAHCGTLFMIEPPKSRAVVLYHSMCDGSTNCPYTHSNSGSHRFEVGLALQQYTTPLGKRNNLYVSLSKPYSQRFSRGSQRRSDYKTNGHTGFVPGHSEIMRLSVEEALSSCHGFKLSKRAEVVSPWKGTKPLWLYIRNRNKNKRCLGVFTRSAVTFQAETIQYYQGALYWFGGYNELKRLSVAVDINCDAVKELLEIDSDKSKVSQWCEEETPGRRQINCRSVYANSVQLTEGGIALPWTIELYKKKVFGGRAKGSSRTIFCSEPSQPTTRSSPKRCCSWKQLHFRDGANGGFKAKMIALL